MTLVVERHIGRDDGSEAPVVLSYSWNPYHPETYWEPAEGGAEAETLTVNGVDVDMWSDEWKDTTEWLIEEANEAADQRDDRY